MSVLPQGIQCDSEFITELRKREYANKKDNSDLPNKPVIYEVNTSMGKIKQTKKYEEVSTLLPKLAIHCSFGGILAKINEECS